MEDTKTTTNTSIKTTSAPKSAAPVYQKAGGRSYDRSGGGGAEKLLIDVKNQNLIKRF
jgi:hypothetical protein